MKVSKIVRREAQTSQYKPARRAHRLSHLFALGRVSRDPADDLWLRTRLFTLRICLLSIMRVTGHYAEDDWPSRGMAGPKGVAKNHPSISATGIPASIRLMRLILAA